MSNRFRFRYISYLLIYAGAVLVFFIIAKAICSLRIWYEEEVLYQILRYADEHALIIGAVLCMIGWGFISSIFLRKWMGYLDEITRAAELLANKPEQLIELSVDLKPIQDELNIVREYAIRNRRFAKAEEQRKNDLLVFLAHDLKTPLTSVLGYLTLLDKEKEISSELREEYTQVALHKAERLEELLNEFFEIARFNLTSMELQKERVNLSRMTEQICSEFIPVLAEKGLFWKLDIAPDIYMNCDPDKMSRVFDNLIRNAVSYSYADTEVNCVLKKSGDNVVIKVQNHGKTISEEKLNRIFDQFFRLDDARNSTTGGAGLGLAIAKEIVELHGGAIFVRSADESVLFEVAFPLS
ncbi:MAG: HAMP domain-containing histidine kinase [Lachnospiraceae bacterium]|nr:HAMP domain-containing histidine kinase [Lachnospiraceae bacterium]